MAQAFEASEAITATTDTGSKSVGANHVITISAQFTEPVVVVNGFTPALVLSNGAAANYSTGSGTNTLTFTYTTRPGDDTQDLQVQSLALNGGMIEDAAGNALAGPVIADLGISINTTPTVSVTARPDSWSAGRRP